MGFKRSHCRRAIIICLAAIGQSQASCEYGSVPGQIVSIPTYYSPMPWEPLDPGCQLKDELSKYFGLDPSPAGKQAFANSDLAILSYGDSVDANTLMDMCHFAEAHGKPVVLRGNGRDAPACRIPGLQWMERFLPGVYPHGPYHENLGNEMSGHTAIPKGLVEFQEFTGKQKPNIVTFSALLWDIARVFELAPMALFNEQLDKLFVAEWMQHTDFWLGMLEGMFDNDTMLVYHNAAYPRLANCLESNQHTHMPLGRHSHVLQLDVAAEYLISKRPRWHFINFEAMSRPFAMSGIHLRDAIHPNIHFTLQTANMYLNLYRDHVARLNSTHQGSGKGELRSSERKSNT